VERYVNLFSSGPAPDGERYLMQFQQKFKLAAISPCIALNHIFYNWGHKFLYSPQELNDLLEQAGFSKIERVSVGESPHVELRSLERHGLFYGEEMNRFETMVFEATK
jgi:hypothetical protein